MHSKRQDSIVEVWRTLILIMAENRVNEQKNE